MPCYTASHHNCASIQLIAQASSQSLHSITSVSSGPSEFSYLRHCNYLLLPDKAMSQLRLREQQHKASPTFLCPLLSCHCSSKMAKTAPKAISDVSVGIVGFQNQSAPISKFEYRNCLLEPNCLTGDGASSWSTVANPHLRSASCSPLPAFDVPD